MSNSKNIIPNKDPKTRILFSKQLTSTDLNHQLTVPTKFLKVAPIKHKDDGGLFITCFDNYGVEWEFPLYIRDALCQKVTDIDLENQCTLPTQFVREPPIFYEERNEAKKFITCFYSYGGQSKFVLYVREGKYPKPTIPPAPWQNFLKEYGLGDGDAVVFYTRPEDDPNASIQIRCMRKRKVPFASDTQWVELREEAKESMRIGSP